MVLLIGGYFIFIHDFDGNVNSSSSSGGSQAPISLPAGSASLDDYQKFEEKAPESDVIQKLPKEGKIKITFFNRLKGYWEAERSYVLTKGAVEDSSDSEGIDIQLTMNSRWLKVFDGNNFCDVVKSAKSYKEFDAETVLSKTKLAWKYKGLLGYRDCLGI